MEDNMEKLKGKMEFYYQFDEGYPTVRVTLEPSTALGEVFESFEGFLRAAGYVFNGTIDTVDENCALQEATEN